MSRYLFFFRLLVTCVAMSIPLASQAQTSPEEAMGRVEEYEKLFWGKSFQFQPKFEEAPEHVQRFRVSISKDGQYTNVFWDFEVAKIKSESCSLSNDQLITAYTSVGGETAMLRGVLQTEFTAVSTVSFAPHLVGISQDDGLRFSSILRDGRSVVSIRPSDLEGEPCTQLVAKNPVFGEYRVWISEAEKKGQIKKITIKKVTGQRWAQGPYHTISSIGGPPPVGVTQDDEEQGKFLEQAAKAPKEVSRETTLFPIVYHKDLPQKMKIFTRSEFDDESSFEYFGSLEVDWVKEFDHPLTDQAKFQNLIVELGTQISVLGQEQNSFEFWNGKIERVLDFDK